MLDDLPSFEILTGPQAAMYAAMSGADPGIRKQVLNSLKQLKDASSQFAA